MRKTALVTGASRGIGFELARLLAADGHDLVLASRNATELDNARQRIVGQYGVPVRCDPTDLSKPGAALDLWRDIEGAGITIDILVNNAGSGVYGPLAQQVPSAVSTMLQLAVSTMLQLNVVTLTIPTRLALPGMLEQPLGQDPERSLRCRLPAGRSTHGRVLCVEVLRPFIVERRVTRSRRDRCHRYGPLSANKQDGIRGSLGRESLASLHTLAGGFARGRRTRGLLGHETGSASRASGLLDEDPRPRRRAPSAAARPGSQPPASSPGMSERLVTHPSHIQGRIRSRVAACAPGRPCRLPLVLRRAHFSRRLAQARAARPEIAWSVACIERTRGRVSIAALRKQTGFSKVRLATLFRDEVGLTPKRYARTVRLRHVLRMLQDGRASLADVALGAAYYDQPHMTAEFRALGDVTPRAFLAARHSVGDGSTATDGPAAS